MNEKTRAQIEAMKNQTIGVEVEMNNITREKAAKKAADSLEPEGMNTQQAGTDTAPGRHGTHREGNGNSRGM